MCNVTRQSCEFKTVEKNIIRVFDLSGIFLGCRTIGMKQPEHIGL